MRLSAEAGARLLGHPWLPGVLCVVAAGISLFVVHVIVRDPVITYAKDITAYYYPAYQFTSAHLREGVIPIWNPHQLCGLPILGNLQSGVLYPGHILYVILPVGLAIAASGLLHLLILAVSTFFLVRRLGLGHAPAVLGAMLAALRGWHPAQLKAFAMLEAEAWFALGLLGVLDVLRGDRLRGAGLVALSCGLSLLAGFPQMSVYSVYGWGGLLGLLLLFDRPPAREWLWSALAFLGGVVLGVALAGAQVLPALEMADLGVRKRGPLPLDLMFPLGPTPPSESFGDLVTQALEGRMTVPILPLSAGFAALLLMPLSLFARTHRKEVAAILCLGAIAFCFGIDLRSPLFELFMALPELSSFRQPNRVLFITDVCMGLLAAYGLHALLGIVRSRMQDKRVVGAVAVAVPGATLVELLAAPSILPPLNFGFGHHPLPGYLEHDRTLRGLRERDGRIWILDPTHRIPEKVGMAYGIDVVSDYEPVALGRQARYFGYLLTGTLEGPKRRGRFRARTEPFAGHVHLASYGIDVAQVAARSRLLDLAAVRWVVRPKWTSRAIWSVSYFRADPHLAVEFAEDHILFENPSALPRSYLARRIMEAPEDELALLGRLARPDFDPRSLSYVEGEIEGLEDLRGPVREGDDAPVAESRIVSETIHELRIEVDAPRGGLLVVADTYYPGWVARVDGREVAIHRTNHSFRGVRVDAGRSEVVMRYEPASVRWGAAASLIGVAGVMAALVPGIRGRARAAWRRALAARPSALERQRRG